MNSEVKEEINLELKLLRNSLIKNHVSIGVSGRNILFFDTDYYVQTGKINGFKIPIEDLVK